jgi:predicted dithiol-disulfide oxidoreductase (DUF899 family)
MGRCHDQRLPGETAAYRQARDQLLEAEMVLRRQVETVAALRRALPRGGRLKENYVFEEAGPDDGAAVTRTRLSALFAPGKDHLVIYSFMYPIGATVACPMCAAFLDSLDGAAPHIGERVNLAVVARAPVATLASCARQRGWRHLRLLSSGNNSYNTDYLAERSADAQLPAINVFARSADGVHHTYNAEMLYAPAEPGQHPRHLDQMWPLWNLLDLTPDGRGADWIPRPATS